MFAKRFLPVASLLFVSSLALHAEIKLPNLFSEHAVLQRGQKIHVWGWGKPGESVTIKLHAQTQTGQVDAQGRFDVFLAPEAAGGPYTLEVNSIKLKDILVGDVFLASGQSNMKYTVNGHPPESVPVHKAEMIAGANIPTLRLLRVPQAASEKPETNQDQKWELCTSETMQEFSLIAYLAGKHLTEEKKVPIGLLESDYGGTPIEAWISQDVYTANPALYLPAKAAFDLFATGTVEADGPAGAAPTHVVTHSMEKRAKDNPRMQASKTAAHKPTNLYNAMISPLAGYTIAGAMWYQGEQDAPTGQAEHYADWISAMIADWRAKWGEGNFPFIIIQISSFGSNQTASSTGQKVHWGTIRDAERRTLSLPNTALVVTSDVGDPGNVHPANKEPVAARVVLAADDLVYGEHVEDFGPLFKSVQRDGSNLKVSFTHAEGLAAKSGTLQGFEVAGADGNFVAVTAKIVKDEVIVSAATVADPKTVRYAWSNSAMEANLFNSAGLPASTFTAPVQ